MIYFLKELNLYIYSLKVDETKCDPSNIASISDDESDGDDLLILWIVLGVLAVIS